MNFRLSIFLIFSLVVFCDLFAQEAYDKPLGSRIALNASLFTTATFDDFGLGTFIGMINRKKNISFYMTFDARPYRRRYLERISGNNFYQFREERYMIGLGMEYIKGFSSGNKGLFVQLNGNYTWAQRGGTEDFVRKGFVLTPRAGMFLQYGKTGLFKLGYTYQDIKTDDISKHRVYIAISGYAENQ